MALKPGFFPHHTEHCDIELRAPAKASGFFSTLENPPLRRYWCNTHNQWCYERPVKISWQFADGEIIFVERPEEWD